MTEALAYVHSKNIVHGDFGAHNILLGEDGEPKLADFGGTATKESARTCAFRTVTMRR